MTIDPKLDLVLERIVDVSPKLVWQAWTQPEHLKHWFTPAPWTTSECEIDLRPGGVFRTVMRDPDGTEHPNVGCYLEVVPQQRLVWTDALLPGFRPALTHFLPGFFTGLLLLEPHADGTRYLAIARHGAPNVRDQHEQMGFYEGWGTVADQMVQYCAEL